MPPRRRGKKKKITKVVTSGVANIYSTFNNTIVTITDTEGNVLAWASGGTAGFKGARKGTPFAAQIAAQSAVEKAKEYKMQTVEVNVKGPGPGREAALRTINSAGLRVKSIRDITPIPHNGCRARKRRRV
jgi:small subunit ribosomal protein S11